MRISTGITISAKNWLKNMSLIEGQRLRVKMARHKNKKKDASTITFFFTFFRIKKIFMRKKKNRRFQPVSPKLNH